MVPSVRRWLNSTTYYLRYGRTLEGYNSKPPSMLFIAAIAALLALFTKDCIPSCKKEWSLTSYTTGTRQNLGWHDIACLLAGTPYTAKARV